MDELFNQGKKKLRWWIYKSTLAEIQRPHLQNDFLKSVTAKLYWHKVNKNIFRESEEWEMRVDVFGCENMWKWTPVYRLEVDKKNVAYNDEPIWWHHAPIDCLA